MQKGGLSAQELLSFNPEEIILLNYLKHSSLESIPNDVEYFIQRYTKAQGHMPDASKYMYAAKRFVDEGFLGYPPEPEGYERLSLYSFTDIRGFLKERNIRTARKRNDLIEIVKENFTEQEVETLFPMRSLRPGVFELTPRGHTLLEYHGHLLYFWKEYKSFYDIQAIHRYRLDNPDISAKEVTIRILQGLMQNELAERSEDRDRIYRSAFLNTARACEFFKAPHEGAVYYALVCYLDINEPVLRGYNRDEYLEMWGGEKEYPSAEHLPGGILDRLDNALDNRPLDVIKEEFFKGANALRGACSPDFLPPSDAWQIIIAETGA